MKGAICAFVSLVAVSGIVTTAGAEPEWTRTTAPRRNANPVWTAPHLAPPGNHGTRGPGFSDSFDTYANGSVIYGQGGWEPWPGGADAFIDNTTASSPPNALRDQAFSDVVHRFSVTSGQWVLRIMTYVPGPTTSTYVPGIGAYVILTDAYVDGGAATTHWAMQVAFNDGSADVVQSQFDNQTLPLVYDTWKEFRAAIDLDAQHMFTPPGGTPYTSGTMDLFYDNQQINTQGPLPYPGNVSAVTSPLAQRAIACIDLYSNGADPMYYDSLTLTRSAPPCRVDVNGDGQVNVGDFLAFLQLFATADPRADFTGDGQVNISDFLAFLQLFAAGCP
jgi:hypothetical protein